jgi:hypothetical protein
MKNTRWAEPRSRFSHATFAVPESETAGPSAPLRSGRDDKGEGSDSY